MQNKGSHAMRPAVWESEFQTNLAGEVRAVGEKGDDE